MMQFNLPKNESSIIKVIGVGGGGSNAVNHMFQQGIAGVDFYICNTDQQALDASPIPNKIQLGKSLTDGRGAGSVAEVGRNAALENIDEVVEVLQNNTKMVFITAGMGGGTGTGAAPIIAKKAKEMGILTVGIVTIPFAFEGKKRKNQADEGMEQLKDNVDTLLVICNDKLREIYGNLSLKAAFAKADDILTSAAKGIAEIITVTGYVNVDFEDVRTVMSNSGRAIMGSATAEGEDRAIQAVQQALSSPLLNDNNIEGANYILLNITSGQEEVLMDEISVITDYIQDEAGLSADIIWGNGTDDTLGDKICVTIIATGFGEKKTIVNTGIEKKEERKVFELKSDPIPAPAPTPVATPVVEPVVATPVVSVPEVSIPEPVKMEETPVVNETPVVEEKVEEPVASTPLTFEWEVSTESTFLENETTETVEMEQQETITMEVVKDNASDLDLPEGWEVKRVEPVEQTPVSETPVRHRLFDDEAMDASYDEDEVATAAPVSSSVTSSPMENYDSTPFTRELDEEENMRRAQERIARLKAFSTKMKSPSGITDLENEPAYMRKNINLSSVTHSSESDISRYTLSEGDDKNTEIRSNNTFLHDNVD